MFRNPDDTRPEGFPERRDLAESYEGRADALKDMFAILHCQVMSDDPIDSNLLRAIQTMEKLHRTVSRPADPEAESQPENTEREDDRYAYDHTGLHKKLAEMSDDDLVSHVEGLVGPLEKKSARSFRAQLTDRVFAGPIYRPGERPPTPAASEKRRGT